MNTSENSVNVSLTLYFRCDGDCDKKIPLRKDKGVISLVKQMRKIRKQQKAKGWVTKKTLFRTWDFCPECHEATGTEVKAGFSPLRIVHRTR